MRKQSHPILVLVLVCLGALLLIPAAAQAADPFGPSFDASLDQVFSSGYPQAAEAHLCSLGSTPLGHRDAGTPGDNAAADFFVKQMQGMGIEAWTESVPVDVWQLNEASVTVGATKIVCSAYTNSTPTPAGGLTGEVVYVGNGRLVDFIAAGDVTGKIVLADLDYNDYSPDFISHQATKRGAKATILTTRLGQIFGKFGLATDLGGGCAVGTTSDVPWVYMARTDADALKTQIAGGPVTATVTVDVTVTTQENGGHGYNALAMIPGSKYPDQIIVVSGHHDAHFGGAIDNTTAVVLQLAMAKAITLSGYKPERTLLFLSTTAEEAGAFNSYWNWMYGSWYLLTKTHMDWPGRVVADINWEFPGLTGVTKASVSANQELIPWLTTFNAAAPADYAPPTSINPTVGVWADSGNFWALGIPVIYLYSSSGSYSFNNYHTQSDDMTLIDWTLLNKNVKLTAAYARGLDTGGSVVTGLLPYSLKARADNLALAANSDPAALLAAGADSAAVTRFSTDIAALQAAGNTYESTKSIIPMSQIGQVNTALLQTIKVLNEPLYGFTSALGAGYNHAIIRTDLLYLGWAIATLQADPTDPTGWGYTYLSWINWQWYNQFFDHASTAEYLALQMPDYERLYAATLFHPATPLDLWTQMDQVKDHNGAAALPALLAAQAQDVAALNASLNRESTAIEQALVIWNDHTAPVTTAAGNDSLWHRSGQRLWITLAAVDNSGGSGVASSEYSIDSAGGPWTTYDYAVMLAPGAFADGPHTFYYRSRDVSGNVETAQSFTFKIDKKGPQTFNVGPYTKSVKRNHTATLRYRVTDTWSSKVTVRIQVVNRLGHTVAVWKVGKVATGWALSYKHRVTLARGTYTCRFKATDQAGNAQSRTGTMHLVVF